MAIEGGTGASGECHGTRCQIVDVAESRNASVVHVNVHYAVEVSDDAPVSAADVAVQLRAPLFVANFSKQLRECGVTGRVNRAAGPKVSVKQAAEAEPLRFVTLDLCWTVPKRGGDGDGGGGGAGGMDYLDGSCLLFARDRFVNFLDWRRTSIVHRKYEFLQQNESRDGGSAAATTASTDPNFGCLEHTVDPKKFDDVEACAGIEVPQKGKSAMAVLSGISERILPPSLSGNTRGKKGRSITTSATNRSSSSGFKSALGSEEGNRDEESPQSSSSVSVGMWVRSRFGRASGAEYVGTITGMHDHSHGTKVDVKYSDGGKSD